MAIQVYGYLLRSYCLSVFLGPCGDGVLALFSLRFISPCIHQVYEPILFLCALGSLRHDMTGSHQAANGGNRCRWRPLLGREGAGRL